MKKLIVLLIALLTFIGCHKEPSVEDVIARSRPAVAMLMAGDRLCTAFHLGYGVIVTANHCVESIPDNEIAIKDYKDKVQPAQVIDTDVPNDLALVVVDHPLDEAFELWSESDGELKLGQPIMSMGFPAYYYQNFTFELGYISDLLIINDNPRIVSKSIVFNGESGGPIIAVKNGKVIGFSSMLSERIQTLAENVHQHHTLSLIVPWQVIYQRIDYLQSVKVETP